MRAYVFFIFLLLSASILHAATTVLFDLDFEPLVYTNGQFYPIAETVTNSVYPIYPGGPLATSITYHSEWKIWDGTDPETGAVSYKLDSQGLWVAGSSPGNSTFRFNANGWHNEVYMGHGDHYPLSFTTGVHDIRLDITYLGPYATCGINFIPHDGLWRSWDIWTSDPYASNWGSHTGPRTIGVGNLFSESLNFLQTYRVAAKIDLDKKVFSIWLDDVLHGANLPLATNASLEKITIAMNGGARGGNTTQVIVDNVKWSVTEAPRATVSGVANLSSDALVFTYTLSEEDVPTPSVYAATNLTVQGAWDFKRLDVSPILCGVSGTVVIPTTNYFQIITIGEPGP